VIVDILNDDGTMARRPDLERFAKQHELKIGTIADLIRYRLDKERSVECISEQTVQTEFGPFKMHCYEDHVNRTVHLVLVHGELRSGEVPLVRVHIRDTLRDVVGIVEENRGWPLRAAMKRIAEEPAGIIILMRPAEDPRDLMEAVESLKSPTDWSMSHQSGRVLRTYGIGAQILRDLGISRMRVLSAPKHFQGLSGFDLEVEEYVDR
jgi:3,4-dihydroxy 2-butanone 4-phosphate synthase/GTP cyclohydrolase II